MYRTLDAPTEEIITIPLPSEVLADVRDRAALRALKIEDYIVGLVRDDLDIPLSGDEALAPFRRRVKESGMTEDDMDALFEHLRDEVRREKRAQRGDSS